MTEGIDESFEALLNYLRDARGFDFTGYKRTSLMRRVRHRMDQAGFDTFEAYLDELQANADEFGALFTTILINVTSFFRDADAWNVLRDTVIPTLLAERGPGDPIRVWSAGCASGQEAYTLAMLLTEALGREGFRQRVKIYATDVDEDALAEARVASYDARHVESVPPELLTRYFEQVNGHYVFDKELRRTVIFGRNDLVKDAPISRVDLLVCRNTLMYLNADTQRSVLGRLHFALGTQGVLFLGHAEMLLSHGDLFSAVDLKHRLFRKTTHPARLGADRFGPTPSPSPVEDPAGLSTIRELAFRASPVAQIVINSEDTVVMVNQQAENVFGLSARDTGRLLRDLEVSYRPVELRAHVEQAKVERRSLRLQDVLWQRIGADAIWFEIHLNPLVDTDNGLLGLSIVFFDVSTTRALMDKVVQANRQLEIAYEELQSTNEELETTNEELQSTVEELETTNEELQSTNEELETMNEELQSTNDELRTINDSLSERSDELDAARVFTDSLIDSVQLAMMVLDQQLRVLVWNQACEDLWGVRTAEALGTPLTALDIGLPMEALRPLIGAALVEPEPPAEIVVEAINRRGKTIRLRITSSSFRAADTDVRGALLLMEVLS